MEGLKSGCGFLSIFLFSVIVAVVFTQRNLIADEQEEWSKLNEKANVHFEQEQYQEAVDTAVQAVEFSVQHFGEEHPATVVSLYTLASFYGQLGNPEAALSLYQQVLPLSTRVLGEDDPNTLMIMTDLAQLYGEQGQYEDARPLLEKVLLFQQKSLGKENQETLMVMTTLAQIYEAMGVFNLAEETLLEAIGLYENNMGIAHPDTLLAKESLASVYNTQGRFEQAETLYRQVLQQKSAALGEKDRETLITMSSMAELYRRMGKFEEAESLFLKAIGAFKEISGEPDPDLYQTMGNLALLYQDRGLYAKAETLYEKVWEFDRSTLGEKHPNTVVDLNNLAGIYRLQGLYGKAEDRYRTSLSYIKEALGEKHPETISIMNNLALLFENQGLYDKSEPLFKKALQYSNELLGQDHPTTLALMNNLASLYESQGVFKKSEPLYNKTIQLNEKVYGLDHPNTIAGVNNLGYLFLIQKEFAKAEPLFSRVLKNWETQLGAKHQKTLKARNNLARVYHGQKKLDQAEAMFIDTLSLRKEVLGEKHPDVVRSMVDLSGLYLAKGRMLEAEALLTETIRLSEEVLGEKHQYTFEALNSLADLYESQGDLEKSLMIRQKAFERRTGFFNQVLWAAGENTRQSYIELHKPEQDRFLSLLTKINDQRAAKLALHSSLQRKGLLLKISSEIHKIVEMTKSPELAESANALNLKRKELASMTLSGPTTETPEVFRKKIAVLENQLDELQAELGRASMIYQLASKPISVDQVFENLAVDDVLIDYITYNDGTPKIMAVVAQSDPQNCFVWWKCKTNRIEIIPLGDLEGIRNFVSIFRETIQDEDAEEDELQATGNDIFKEVWKPLQPFIGGKKSIYIVPDSILHLLPFDAMLDDDGNYLIESKDLKVLSSSRDLVVASLPDAYGDFMILAGPDYDLEDVKVQTKKAEIKGRRGGVGKGMRIASHGLRSLSFDPLDGAELEGKTIKKVSDSFEALPGAEDEGKVIKEVAEGGQGKSVIFIKKDAEEQQLRVFKSPPKMLHIATHGFFLQAEERLKKRLLSLNRGGTMLTPPPGDNPLLRAGLAFAGINSNAPYLGEIDTNNDGVLTAMEVIGLSLAGTQLVVLSACETGVGEIHAGEGVYGLRRSFQEAGVKSVVNSLWPVSDEGTRRLMTEFYKRLFEGLPARKALKEAQLTLLQSEWNSPYYWASFVLVERRFTAGL